MSKGEKILKLIQHVEKLEDKDIDEVNKAAEACLIVQTLKKLKLSGAIAK